MVLITAMLALAKPEYRQKTLAFHAVALAAGAAALLIWGLSLTLGVAPSTPKITWSVGWLTAIASYSAYLVSQTVLTYARSRSVVVKYAYFWIGAAAFAVDVYVFIQLASSGF